MSERFPFETDKYTLHDYQRETVRRNAERGKFKRPRVCLYYRTGAGKTLTAIASLRAMGREQALVVAPPLTHDHWRNTGQALGVTVDTMSHAKFRQRETKLSRTEALVVDEFHMLGGYKAVGFKKLERISGSLQAPLIIASATPNYNDVERCYCIQRIVDPTSTQGGYMAFLYKHCNVDVNPWGHVPRVNGFTKYPDAATFLQDMRNVEFIEDNLTYTIDDVTLTLPVPGDLLTYGIDRRNERVIGSQIEEKHRLIEHALVTESGELAPAALELVLKIVFDSPTPTLIFAVHTSVVSAAVASLLDAGVVAVGVTGKTRPDLKAEAVDAFRSGQLQALVGTVTLATGTDGLDKMCDTLLILDDTEDDAMRRQLIGRIMPRGHAAVVAHNNRVVRLVSDITAAP